MDLEDLKQSKLTEKNYTNGEAESRTPFINSLLGASVPAGAESDLWPTLTSREQRGYQKSDPGGDHYYVGS